MKAKRVIVTVEYDNDRVHTIDMMPLKRCDVSVHREVDRDQFTAPAWGVIEIEGIVHSEVGTVAESTPDRPLTAIQGGVNSTDAIMSHSERRHDER